MVVWQSTRNGAVHPHVRGEDVAGAATHDDVNGSPPRAWGRPRGSRQATASPRFTPTCVGKTILDQERFYILAVHPHVRGEDCNSNVELLGDCGSPPRAWGRPHMLAFAGAVTRFTPTCVGKTSGQWACAVDAAVHPHVRGEDCCCAVVLLFFCRFTPTCVGKTHVPRPVSGFGSVHPHVRGEDLRDWPTKGSRGGSPPHAW